MNWQHLQAFIWLRWRLMYNQWRRAGAFNAVLMMILSIGLLVTVIPLFIGCLILGLYLIPKAAPVHLLYAWDGLIVAFLLFWGIGLVTELQRTEPLALSKFLHLPVSVTGAFLINYFSSLVRLSLIFFGPLMLAFSLALIFTKGILLLPVILSLAAFLLMISALTYQVQGWLAALMSNPRRRRTVVVVITMSFILLAQLPNLINFLSPWGIQQRVDRSTQFAEEMAKLNRDAPLQKLDHIELARRQQELLQKHQLAEHESAKESEQAARLANMVLPVGWLPLGVMYAAEGNVLPSLLGLLGMGLIGTVSLWRAYGTTLQLYQGQPVDRKDRPAPAPVVASPVTVSKPGELLLEARLPGLSEPVSAIALGGFRSLLRSPEAKMMLLSPVIMIPILGSMLFKAGGSIPEVVRPLVAIGGMAFVLLGLVQLMGNQFGFDRDGFRVFVLSPASRRDILLGKNLTFVPLVLILAAILLVMVQALCPLRVDHVLAMVPQVVSMFLLFCIFTNLASIYTPVYIAAGSLKPANPKTSTILIQMVMFLLIFPLTQSVTLLPLGIETLLRFLGWPAAIPIFLVLALLECAVIVLLYRFSLVWQGDLFQAREQKILESVTNRGP